MKACLHRRLPFKIFFWYSVNGQKKSINYKFLHQSMHKNFPHVKVHPLAPLGSVMSSLKGITASEQLTWEQRRSQNTFILNPFNSYYNYQSSGKTHTASPSFPVTTSVWSSDAVPPRAPGFQVCSLTVLLPLNQDLWSLHLTLVKHNWILLSVHGTSLELWLISSQSQRKFPL